MSEECDFFDAVLNENDKLLQQLGKKDASM